MLLLILLYLVAGLIVSTFVEDEDGNATFIYRILAMLFWPAIVIYTYIILFRRNK